MMNKTKKFLLGPSGGTASSMSAFMQSFVQDEKTKKEVYFVPEMWRTMAGLTDRNLVYATKKFVTGWENIGGSPIIPSCKNTNVFKIKQEDGTSVDLSGKVKDYCSSYDGVIAVGGGGTTYQCLELNEAYGLKFIVALATMDNDILCFDNVLGFETAVQRSGAAIAACYYDAMTMQRPTMVFSMGYDCGRLAVNATKHAMSKYGAKIDMLQIPETQTPPEEVAAKIKEKYKGGAFTIVISEGCCKPSSGTADGVHKTYSTSEYAQEIMNLTGIKFKVITPDYMQRSGPPVAEDIVLAKKFADKALELINAGKWNRAIGCINGEIVSMKFDKITKILKSQNINSNWYKSDSLSLDEVKDIII